MYKTKCFTIDMTLDLFYYANFGEFVLIFSAFIYDTCPFNWINMHKNEQVMSIHCTAYQQLQIPKNVRKPNRWLEHSRYGISYSYMDPIIWLQYSIDLAAAVSPNEFKYLFRFCIFIRKRFWSDNFWLLISNWIVAGGFSCSFFCYLLKL